MKITLLTWNVHGLPYPFTQNRAARLKRIAERIESEQPDVALLQEAWPGSIGPLTDGLANYSTLYAPTSLGSAAGGLVVLVRRSGRFRADEPALRFRPYTTYAPLYRFWEADGLAGKGAVFLPLVRADGQRIWIVNTHLQARYGSRDYRVIRRAQLRELRRWIDALGEKEPVLVAGDFNTPARIDPAYAELQSIGIDHAWLLHESGTRTTNYPLHSTAGWIDYVLLRGGPFESRGGVRLIENERIDHPYSDHSAIVADIELFLPEKTLAP
jgi:endonuclease/exonuclease/phosphatase family metal-dependent hydrolase